MGAEQIGYLSKGPKRIPLGRIKAAVRACRRLRQELLAAAEDPESEAARRTVALDRTGIDFDPQDIDDDPEPVIREFVDWWRTLDGRDTCSRTDPDDDRQVLVYAGEMSCGDEPEGQGYQMLQRAFAWGFAEALGVR